MPKVEVSAGIRADLDKAYETAKDAYRTGRFGNTTNVRSVTVLEEGPDYSVSEWDVVLQGKGFKWTERDTYDEERKAIRFEQVKGDLAKLSGECLFEEGTEGVAASMWVDFDFGVPMLAAILNPIATAALRKNLREMLDCLKGWTEGD